MIDIKERPINDAEKKILLGHIPSNWQRFENRVLLFIYILMPQLGVLLFVDKYWIHIESRVQAMALMPVLGVTTFLTLYFYKKLHGVKLKKSDIDLMTVTIYHVTTDRVVKRKDPEDFGPTLYFDLGESVQFKTLCLSGQYLYEFKRKKFPSTEFILKQTKEGQTIGLIPKGLPLKPFKTIKPFTDQDYTEGKDHKDGELLLVSVDEIIKMASVA